MDAARAPTVWGATKPKQGTRLRRRLGDAGDLDAFRTEVSAKRAKSIISTNDSPDITFDQSINPYRGCEHGCIYCYARPTHAYLGHSPGLDFETKLFAKTNAAELLDAELAHPRTCPRSSRSVPSPIPTSRSSASTASPARILEVLDARRPSRSASSPNRRWSCATSTSSRAWLRAGWPRSRSR